MLLIEEKIQKDFEEIQEMEDCIKEFKEDAYVFNPKISIKDY